MEHEICLLSPWTAPRSPEPLAIELGREAGPDHPLFGKSARALAVRCDRDDVLFEIADGRRNRYAVVHLTWRGRQEISDKFPSTRFFDSLENWLQSMRDDHEDYEQGEAPVMS